MIDADLVLVHGFWSSPATWDQLSERLQADLDLRGLRVHRFEYESPKLSLPFSRARIPDYNDIAQSLPSFLSAKVDGRDTVIVTHSQGGLIVQRFLAWMLDEGRSDELRSVKLVIMLACPNEGTEFGRSVRKMARFGRHAQARDLQTLSTDVTSARRTVLRQVVYADGGLDRPCRIPFMVYAGRTDPIVTRSSAQSVFPDAETLPGDHFSILHASQSGNLTFETLKRKLLERCAGDPDDVPTEAKTDQISLTRSNAWGGIAVTPTRDAGVRVVGPASASGGITQMCHTQVAGFSMVRIQVRGSADSDFTGWSEECPKMLKLELDGIPLICAARELLSDDPEYVVPHDGSIDYRIPKAILNKGHISKMVMVFGKGTLRGLELRAKLV